MPSDSLSPEEQYEITYQATKNAIWDVLGTAVYLVFLIFAVAIALFAIAFPAIGSLATGDVKPFVVGVAVLGLAVVGFGSYRIYQLVQ
ncbi:hypothetical protein C453_03179 [Haloferax elongans ATCC BAA-1513]|uniref:Cox cluster protein n=1 Tax=Haloferax elongans ATCC BAA-1513 TaxID=1230453 RepID=M0HRV5_HALEO|nr:hypothetical protein [Haloferax elongans]ELZ87320.1 hypothetical protein C453_03179 [Haloferax elongans ATCC BAA-1513]